MLDKDSVVWERDEKGELIPQTVDTADEINGKIEQVKVIPLTRGERKKLMTNIDDKGNTSKDADKEIVLKHLIEPKFTEEDLENTNFGVVEILATTVLIASGLPINKDKNVKKANEKIESDFQDASEK